jgi:hypothetical protein
LNELNDEYESKLKIAYEQRDKLVGQYEKTKDDYKRKLEEILEENKNALSHFEQEYRGMGYNFTLRKIRRVAEEPHQITQW